MTRSVDNMLHWFGDEMSQQLCCFLWTLSMLLEDEKFTFATLPLQTLDLPSCKSKKKKLFSKHDAHAVLYVKEVQGRERQHPSRDTLTFLGYVRRNSRNWTQQRSLFQEGPQKQQHTNKYIDPFWWASLHEDSRYFQLIIPPGWHPAFSALKLRNRSELPDCFISII